MNTTVKRSISGTIFLVVFLCGLLLNEYIFAALFIFMIVGMLREFYKMTMGSSFRYSRALAIVAGVVLFILIFCAMAFDMTPKMTALALVPVIILMITSLYTKDKSEFAKFSHIYTGLMYIAIPLSMAPFIMFGNDEFDGMPMLCFFILIHLNQAQRIYRTSLDAGRQLACRLPIHTEITLFRPLRARTDLRRPKRAGPNAAATADAFLTMMLHNAIAQLFVAMLRTHPHTLRCRTVIAGH